MIICYRAATAPLKKRDRRGDGDERPARHRAGGDLCRQVTRSKPGARSRHELVSQTVPKPGCGRGTAGVEALRELHQLRIRVRDAVTRGHVRGIGFKVKRLKRGLSSLVRRSS